MQQLHKLSGFLISRNSSNVISGTLTAVQYYAFNSNASFATKGKSSQVSQVTPSKRKGPVVEQYYVVPPACPPPPHNPRTLKDVPNYTPADILKRVSEAATPMELINSALGPKYFNQSSAVAKLVRLSEIIKKEGYNRSDKSICSQAYESSVKQLNKLLQLSTDAELGNYIWVQGQLPYDEYRDLVSRSLRILMEDDGRPLKTGSPVLTARTAAGLASLKRRDPEVWKVLVPLLNKNIKENNEVELSNSALAWFNNETEAAPSA